VKESGESERREGREERERREGEKRDTLQDLHHHLRSVKNGVVARIAHLRCGASRVNPGFTA
jgi:hypothetical protein